jgi:dimethylhistidine N-methyltransferase
MTPRLPNFLSAMPATAADPATELAAGLLAPTATVSPKFLYDRLGSALFVAITELPEYYPTRTEAAILTAHESEIARALQPWLPPGFALVDLGAGDGAKAARLLGPLKPGRYVAVDISEAFLQPALSALQRRHPEMPMMGVSLDFSRRLVLPPGVVQDAALVFYPGSSIGNFGPDEALRLLREAHAVSCGGALLIGADLCKPHAVLEQAYDDPLGVTAAFNLNLLRHANAILGSDFDVRDWRHLALFNAAQARVEMHLEARRALSVRWPGARRDFAAGERIHTENSYKWEASAFESLLRDAGWRHVQRWTDPAGWFGVFLAQA